MTKINTGILALNGVLTIAVAGQQNVSAEGNAKRTGPNFIVIFADDMGYGDIGVYGHPTIKTPNLDRMATQGQKWTNFYCAAPVSTPSRSALLTGRLPIRTGMSSEKRRVLFPDSKGGLPQAENTIARLLKAQGYRTAAVGKWHLGHQSPYLPTDHGFESYFGIPYSNDMDKIEQTDHFTLSEKERYQAYNVPLMRNNKILERPADQRIITKLYTEEIISKIKEYKNESFFLYMAHSFPHIPLFRSADFKGKSLAGIYGDVIEELDWSVGQILSTLEKEGIDKNTLVVFTSDNGPWLTFGSHGGTAGLLSGGKGGTYEGGMRVPGIFWWPGMIKPGVVMEMGMTLDLLPTFCKLANAAVPADRMYDGYDISPVLLGTGQDPREVVFYYRDVDIFAVRKGAYKAHFFTQSEYGTDARKEHNPPLLFDVNIDPSEKQNIADKHPEVIKEIMKIVEQHRATLKPVENQLEK